ncbi:MAG: pilus assembly protein PilM [Clostridiaceae bacterium]|nr:pilus assembly protein PilM [Clostridiaceae bacterium]
MKFGSKSIRSKSIIGLDMDSKEIRAVELKGSKKKPTVTAWGRINLPEGVVKDGRIIQLDKFSDQLSQFLLENSFKTRDVILGVNNQDVIIRFASFPKVPEDKIKSMIKFQAQDYIPIPLEEMELDYIILGEKNTEVGQYIDVVLVAARKRMLNDFILTFTDARLTINEIDTTMLALGRAALSQSSGGVFALVCFNYDIGNILIFKDTILGMARSVSISQSLNMPLLKDIHNKKNMEIIADILFNEIKASVSYYKSQTGYDIDKIFVLGPDSNQRLVASRLKDTTGLAVKVPEPYKYLEKHVLKQQKNMTFKATDYVASISLALRGLEV